MKHVVVGGGGIGSYLIPLLCRYLNYNAPGEHEVLIIDGKQFEERKRERQVFSRNGSKANVLAAMYQEEFPDVRITAQHCFVDESNVDILIESGDVVFCSPDNHPTRRVLSEHLQSLDDGLLISAGNDYYDGDVGIYQRVGGADISGALHELYPEIGEAYGPLPSELSCEELTAVGEPQLVFANALAGVLMAVAYWCITTSDSVPFSRLDFNLKLGIVQPSLKKGN